MNVVRLHIGGKLSTTRKPWAAAPCWPEYLLGTLVLVCQTLAFVISAAPARADETTRPVPKASCGPQDRTESGLQGQTTLTERFSSGTVKAYHCNLELVGQLDGEGSGLEMAATGNVVVYSTWPRPGLQHPGVPVVDVSDSRHPRVKAYLDSAVMRDVNESLAFDATRKLLFGSTYTYDPRGSGAFEIYDLSGDLSHPLLKASGSLPGMEVHAGAFAPDGRTFYGANCGPPCNSNGAVPSGTTASPPSAVFAIDTTNPSSPSRIAMWIPPGGWRTHAISLKRDGTRAYVAIGNPTSNPNGLAILDTSEIQARRPNPQFHLISTIFWDDTGLAAFALPVRIQSRQYVIFTDTLGGNFSFDRGVASSSCASGKPPWGFARIIDVDDEKHPKTASKLMLEVHDPGNCSKLLRDTTILFGYGSLACDVDRDEDARLAACGYNEAGLRVFDIRDPSHPKEIAYYKPPARRSESRPGSPIFFAAPLDHTADAVISPKFLEDGEIAFNSTDNGFQIVRFIDRFKASHPDLFRP